MAAAAVLLGQWLVCLRAGAKLEITALMCLAATAALSLVVAHGTRPYGFEDSAIDLLARPSAVRAWVDLIGLLAARAIIAALMVSFAFGQAKRAVSRVAVYAVFALVAVVISEHVAKPLVQRTYYGELSSPQGTSPQ